VQTAVKHDASLIVLGPHRRSGLLGHLQGSVAAAVVAHCSAPVLIVPQRAEIPRAAQAFPTTEAAAR
jgi:nucleotide-binding universal stress UspA family protein